MPTFESYEPGWPCWIDLMSPDIDASTAFYRAVFGWESTDETDQEGNRIYTNFELDGKRVAGLGGQPPQMSGAPAIWSTYICTADVDTTAKAVEAAGGTVTMPPMRVMDAGHMAVFTDPTGAAFSVWQPDRHPGAGLANEPNTWSWNELLTRDVDAALPFYAKVFGWEYDSQQMPDGSTYHVIQGGDHGGLGGLMTMPGDMPDMVPNHWMVYFLAADADTTLAKATEAGGQLAQEPFDVPGVGRIGIAHDPLGGSFSVMQPESMG